jgi:peroxiredoxin
MDERAAIQRQYGIMNYPSTFLIDRDGRIVARHFGSLTAQQIDQMLVDLAFSS